jgi:two-component system sensor histidine kinase YesM
MDKPAISSKRLILAICMIFIIPFTAFLLFYNLYMANIMERQAASTNMERLEFHQTAFEDELKGIEAYLANIAANDLHFGQLRYKLSVLDAHLFSFNVLQKHKDMLSSRKIIGCLGLYTGKNGLFRKAFSSELDYETRMELNSCLLELSKSGEHLWKRGWFHQEIEGRAFLLRYVGIEDLMSICAIDLNQLSSGSILGDEIFCAAASGEALTGREFLSEADIGMGHDWSEYRISGRPQRYLLVRKHSGYLGLDYMYASIYGGAASRGDFLYATLLGATFVLVFLILVCFLMMHKLFFMPLSEISSIMGQISEVESEVKMPNSNIREFRQFGVALDNMMQQIKRWRIVAYEKTLAAQESQMQYLQIQIRPHFYLNCLKSLYNLAQRKETGKIQKMILLLSGYMRAVFMQSDSILPLSKEIANVENYVMLAQLTSSKPIMLKAQIDERLAGFEIPSLAILTFVENAIKHAASIEKPLSISIKASLLEGDGEIHVNIAVHDNGPGFTKDMLNALNAGGGLLEKGGHIGIANALRRLDIHYRSKAVVTFMNSSGASIEFFLPFLRMDKSNSIESKSMISEN